MNTFSFINKIKSKCTCLYADCCCYSLTGVSSPIFPELYLSSRATAKNIEKYNLWNFIKLFIQFILLIWQADYKLSYALKYCNPQSTANIRFGSGVPTVCMKWLMSWLYVYILLYTYTCTINMSIFVDTSTTKL